MAEIRFRDNSTTGRENRRKDCRKETGMKLLIRWIVRLLGIAFWLLCIPFALIMALLMALSELATLCYAALFWAFDEENRSLSYWFWHTADPYGHLSNKFRLPSVEILRGYFVEIPLFLLGRGLTNSDDQVYS